MVDEEHLNKLDYFACQFGMISMFALVICLADEKAIHLILSRAKSIRKEFPRVKNGYSLRFSKSARQGLFKNPFIDYSCWNEETIGTMDFDAEQ